MNSLIQFLEKEYGCRLFIYENRKLIKTPAAQMLEDYLRSVQQRENFLREKIKNNGLRELRIGATKTIGDYVITDRIHDFLNQPDTALTLIVDNTKHLLHLLEQNTLDYAIIEGFFDKNRFGSQLYRREPFVGTALELWLSWRKSFWSIMNLWSVFTGIYVFPALR